MSSARRCEKSNTRQSLSDYFADFRCYLRWFARMIAQYSFVGRVEDLSLREIKLPPPAARRQLRRLCFQPPQDDIDFKIPPVDAFTAEAEPRRIAHAMTLSRRRLAGASWLTSALKPMPAFESISPLPPRRAAPTAFSILAIASATMSDALDAYCDFSPPTRLRWPLDAYATIVTTPVSRSLISPVLPLAALRPACRGSDFCPGRCLINLTRFLMKYLPSNATPTSLHALRRVGPSARGS